MLTDSIANIYSIYNNSIIVKMNNTKFCEFLIVFQI